MQAQVNYWLDDDGEALRQRHERWWRGEETLFSVHPGPPLGDLWLPLADGTLAREDLDMRPEMLDVERATGEPEEPGPLQHPGDHFATRAAFSRVPWVEAILGSPIRATIIGGSMRTEAAVRDWDEWEQRAGRRDMAWLDLLERLTAMLVAKSGGQYAVAHTLMRGPTDLAEALLGPELMSFALYDAPGRLRAFLDTVTEAFSDILHAQQRNIPPVAGGAVNAFGIWAAGPVVRTQCDASAILSPRQYAEWYLPYDLLICEAVDYSTIHLHSCSLHTVDALLAQDRPHAIQVTWETAGPNLPTLPEAIDIFCRILDKKCLILEGPFSDDDVELLRRELPQGGFSLGVRTEEW